MAALFDKIDFVLLFLIFSEFVFVLIVFFIIKILCSVELKSNYNSNYNNCYYNCNRMFSVCFHTVILFEYKPCLTNL